MRVGGKIGSDSRGFTLLEVFAAIAILVVLATVLVLRFGDMSDQSQRKQAQRELAHIQQALEAYKAAFGSYPRDVSVGGGDPAMEVILFNALSGALSPNGKLGNFKNLVDRGALQFESAVFPVVGGTPALIETNWIVDPWGNPVHYRFDPESASWENYRFTLFSAGPDGVFNDVDSKGYLNDSHADNLDNVVSR